MSEPETSGGVETVRIFLQPSAFERVLETPPGKKPQLYSWDLIIDTGAYSLPEGAVFAGRGEFVLPTQEEAVRGCVADYDRRIAKAYEDARKAAAELQERKQNLLAISLEVKA